MRCKKHISDFSSNIGVCASCLRERLFYLIEAQAQAEAEAQAQTQPQSRHREGCQSHHSATVQSTTQSHLPHHQPSRFDDRHRNPNPPPPLVFPRSVSPYISRRKSEKTFDGSGGAVDESPIHHRMFFSTPQLGPTYRTNDINFKEEAEVEGTNKNKNKKKKKKKKKKWSKFPVISDLLRFRSRWRKSNHHHTPITDPIPRVSSQPIPSTSDAASSSSSSTWMSNLLNQDGGGGGGGSVPRRKNQKSIVRMFSLDEAAASRRERRRIFQKDRGMSPDLDQENDDDDEELARDHHPETPEHWRRTPTSTILRTSQGRFRASPGRSSFGSVANGWGLCLSPLVRASPVNRPWNGGGCGVLTSSGQESVGYSGEIRSSPSTMTGKPHLSTNRSRKIADFGRFNHNR